MPGQDEVAGASRGDQDDVDADPSVSVELQRDVADVVDLAGRDSVFPEEHDAELLWG